MGGSAAATVGVLLLPPSTTIRTITTSVVTPANAIHRRSRGRRCEDEADVGCGAVGAVAIRLTIRQPGDNVLIPGDAAGGATLPPHAPPGPHGRLDPSAHGPVAIPVRSLARDSD